MSRTAAFAFGSAATLLLALNAWYPHRPAAHQTVEPLPKRSPAEEPSKILRRLQLSPIGLEGCGRLFIDGGSNTGEAVERFVAGGFHGCAMSAPHRVYPKAWATMDVRGRRALMAPLLEPSSFCIRSFEAAPELLPPLHVQGVKLRQKGFDVRFIDGALGNLTATSAPRTVIRYASG